MCRGKRWMRLMCVGILSCAGLAALAADPVVSNVRVAQRQGTGILDITYDLADPDSTNLTVTVNVSTNDGVSWFAPSASNLNGAVGSFAVSPGNSHKVAWQGERELPARFFPSVKAKITADDTAPPLYLVFDLSGGTNATSYPVRYYRTLAEVPGGPNSDAYKTTNLIMRLISNGAFTMGSPDGEFGHEDKETQHQVILSHDFYVGVFAMTQKQWERVVGNWPSYFTNATSCDSRPVETVNYNDIRGSGVGTNWPASNGVDMDSFMGKLRARTGKAFDLPTEAQWEYACRAGTTTALNSGKDLTDMFSCPNMDEVGRYYYNGGNGYTPNGDSSVGTAKVGSYLPNAWGLYDMHGNVWELCLDHYDNYAGSETDPKGAIAGSSRVIRGGGFGLPAFYCRSACRYDCSSDIRDCQLGFRIVLTLGQY